MICTAQLLFTKSFFFLETYLFVVMNMFVFFIWQISSCIKLRSTIKWADDPVQGQIGVQK
jgi:hypothetical protein